MDNVAKVERSKSKLGGTSIDNVKILNLKPMQNGDEVGIDAWICVIGDRRCKGGEVGNNGDEARCDEQKKGSAENATRPATTTTAAEVGGNARSQRTCAKPPPPNIPTPHEAQA
ncbi:hypothetical protein BDN70DRAFT_900433 [Pholiota conissans]|uniref:Uncharacterized protein n=1 Tax=Pholiota conissans TaxID=109636 RepID=A0A9P6CMR7_9AGAR|nr:hypothetical protein BDN70DRAFT_900433 [Pholiota conissans]